MPQHSIDIDAPPEAVYAMVSDLPAMGRWSPECYRCEWLGGATAAAQGARFKGYNKVSGRRWTTTGTVVVAEPGRELTFDVQTFLGQPVSRWTYRITPRDGGCRVEESTEDRRSALVRLSGRLLLAGTPAADRTQRNQDTIEVTLQRIKKEAEEKAT